MEAAEGEADAGRVGGVVGGDGRDCESMGEGSDAALGYGAALDEGCR